MPWNRSSAVLTISAAALAVIAITHGCEEPSGASVDNSDGTTLTQGERDRYEKILDKPMTVSCEGWGGGKALTYGEAINYLTSAVQWVRENRPNLKKDMSLNDLRMFIQLTKAESNGCQNSRYFNSDGTVDKGPLQINSIHNGEKGFEGLDFSNVEDNFRAGVTLWSMRGLKSWSAFNTLRYMNELDNARDAVEAANKLGLLEDSVVSSGPVLPAR